MRDSPNDASAVPTAARALAVAVVAWLPLYLLLAPRGTLIADVLYQVPITVTLAVMVRVVLARGIADRPFWAWMASGVALWVIGDTLWAAFELTGIDPTPSPADGCYVAGMLLALVALSRALGSSAWLRNPRAMLDTGVLTVATLTIGISLVVAPQLSEGLDATVVLALTVNALDMICIVPALLLLAGARRGAPLGIALMAVVLIVDVAGDGAYTWLAANDAYESGHPVDLVWIVTYTLAAIAGLIALRTRTAKPCVVERDLGLPLMLGGFAALAVFWLLRDRDAITGAIVAGALIAVLVRLLLTARESRRMEAELAAALAERARIAVTDPVTGLGSREAVEDVLRGHAEPGARLGVVALELDAAALPFERRDAVMTEAAERLRAVAGASAMAGRTGACELVLVVRGELREPVRATGERLRAAIGSEPFSAGAIGACVGVASAPGDGSTGEELLRAALAARDTARELGGNQVRAAGETVGVPLLESIADAVDERRGRPGHSRSVSRWAAAVAAELGLGHEARREMALAGRLHDLPLVSAPEALLLRPHTPGHGNDPRLDEHPLAVLRLPPRVHELLAPSVAALDRQHEPLADDLPLAARIVAVCNAWATLREGRPGRAPLGVEAARAHLLRRSGTAYAPDVVRAFLQLEARGEIATADPRPARSTADTAGEVLAAAVTATAEPAAPARARAPGRRRSVLLLAGAIAVFVAWTGSVIALQVSAGRHKDRVVELIKADRHLHELELLQGRTLNGDITIPEATAIGRRTHAELLAAITRGDAPPALRAQVDRLELTARTLVPAVTFGDSGALGRPGAQVHDQLEGIDAMLDSEINRRQSAADRHATLAWELGVGSGVLAFAIAGAFLVGFARTRRTTGRLRTAAARAEGERAALRESQRRFRALVQHASDSVLVTAADGRITYATDSIERLLGHSAAALRGRRVSELVDAAHAGRLADLLVAARGMPDATAGELTLRHRDGGPVHADLRVSDRLEDPDVTGIVLTIRDVTERRRLESELQRSGLVDRLTGLPNRARFEEWLQHSLAHGAELAIALIDLDDLGTINDSLGHRAGDHCLVVWAERLRAALAGGERLARLGGDQFGVLLEGVADAETAEAAARRLLTAGGTGVALDRVELPLSGTAGVAVAAPGDLTEDVLRSADTAAHAATSQGSGQVVAFSPSMHARAVRQLELRTALGAAVEREEFELAYQPVVDLGPEAVSGVEALLRWRTPDGEPVPPADFIPIAEASGLIVPLGAWVLRRACADVAPLDGVSVAVNVSAVQLRSHDFADQVAAALSESALAPERLTVELTESALMDDVAAARDAFALLRALGVRVAIDDFGTGFSSLATLVDLPVDVLKLDRSFVGAMSSSPAHAALVGGVVSLAERLGLPLVAEGVETAEQLAALRALGCAYAQGYHLGRPGPLAAVDARTVSLG